MKDLSSSSAADQLAKDQRSSGLQHCRQFNGRVRVVADDSMIPSVLQRSRKCQTGSAVWRGYLDFRLFRALGLKKKESGTLRVPEGKKRRHSASTSKKQEKQALCGHLEEAIKAGTLRAPRRSNKSRHPASTLKQKTKQSKSRRYSAST
jgi:hypothetical protein